MQEGAIGSHGRRQGHETPQVKSAVNVFGYCGGVILKKKTPWPGSASELYRQSDRRLWAK
jgi:hypothetical protein